MRGRNTACLRRRTPDRRALETTCRFERSDLRAYLTHGRAVPCRGDRRFGVDGLASTRGTSARETDRRSQQIHPGTDRGRDRHRHPRLDHLPIGAAHHRRRPSILRPPFHLSRTAVSSTAKQLAQTAPDLPAFLFDPQRLECSPHDGRSSNQADEVLPDPEAPHPFAGVVRQILSYELHLRVRIPRWARPQAFIGSSSFPDRGAGVLVRRNEEETSRWC